MVIEPDIVKMLREEEKLGKFDMVSQQLSKGRDISKETSRKILDNQKIKNILFVGKDITERKKMEDLLKIRNHVIESSINAIVITDLEGNLTYLNQSFVKLWGYMDESEILGNSMLNFWKNKSRITHLMETLTEQDSYIGEFEAERKDGTTFHTQLSANIVQNEMGENICMMFSFVDVTKLKEAEEEIIRTKEHLHKVINSTSEIIVTFDKNNKVTSWNKSAENITGYKRREIIGKSVGNVKVFANSSELIKAINCIHNGHKTEFDELILKTKSEANHTICVSCSDIRGGDKKPEGVFLVGKDITKYREIHGKLSLGKSYLITDNNASATYFFENLINTGFKGLLITRTDPKDIIDVVHSKQFEILLLNKDRLGNIKNISNLNELTTSITQFIRKKTKSVVLLDRIDYLITRFSFEEFIDSLYQIDSVIVKNNSLLLVHLNPSILDERQMSIVKEELQPLPNEQIGDLQIDDELFHILKFINQQNQNYVAVTFKKISKEFSIVKSTAARRLKILEDKGLILIKKQGRSKTITLSDKGNRLLFKR
ncbi:MAG: PAS domain S-box protein [Thermoplasmatales archaeon]|nr:PAS domain S-box protein [Thermoplasmatales archaeon]